jgi:hypothetical protein
MSNQLARVKWLMVAVLLLSACSQEPEPGEILPAAEMREQSGLTAEDRPVIQLDPDKVPADLQDLIPYAEQWGIGDDIIRGDVQAKASDAEKQALQAALTGRNARITAWLDEQGATGMSDEAAAFMYMQLGLDEMGLWVE